MTIGNLGALLQRDVKRMLAYSSIAHAGYLLVAFTAFQRDAVATACFYTAAYAAMNVGAFVVLTQLSGFDEKLRTIDDFTGLALKRPMLSALFGFFLLSLIGIPFTGGFFGKFYVFSAAIHGGYIWLAVVGLPTPASPASTISACWPRSTPAPPPTPSPTSPPPAASPSPQPWPWPPPPPRRSSSASSPTASCTSPSALLLPQPPSRKPPQRPPPPPNNPRSSRNKNGLRKAEAVSSFTTHYSLPYFTYRKMMTNVNSASDSINASPRIRKVKIPGRAPGLRASASVAEAVARPWPRPQSPAASAMPIPAAIGVHGLEVSPAACANAGVARSIAAIAINPYFIMRSALTMYNSMPPLISPPVGG